MVDGAEQTLPAVHEYMDTKPFPFWPVMVPETVIWHCGAPTARTFPDEATA